jgi:hypothetical protein
LVGIDWDHNYPLSIVVSRDRNMLDHIPLILNTGASSWDQVIEGGLILNMRLCKGEGTNDESSNNGL